MRPVQICIGEKFNRLTAVAGSGKNKWGTTLWRFLCDCGNEVVAIAAQVKRGKTRSCGCYNRDKNEMFRTHGMSRSPLHNSWWSMLQRCSNPATEKYPGYGGRGISVCDRWLDFNNFLADMGERPPGHQIERVNNDGNYEPGNCVWATPKTQARNRRNNRFVVFRGRRMCLAEASELSGLSYHIVKRCPERLASL